MALSTGGASCGAPKVRPDNDLFDLHRQRRRAAYEHAAAVHGRAALVHEAAAAFFERDNDRAAATREWFLARQELIAAERDRDRACEVATASEL